MRRLFNLLIVLIFLCGCYPANYSVLKDGVFGVGKIYRPFEIYELINVEVDSSGFPLHYTFGEIAQCYPNGFATNQNMNGKRKDNYSYSVSFDKKTKDYSWCLKPCSDNDNLETIPLDLLNGQWYMFTHIGEMEGYIKDTIYFNYSDKGKYPNYHEHDKRIVK